MHEVKNGLMYDSKSICAKALCAPCGDVTKDHGDGNSMCRKDLFFNNILL